MKFEIKNALGHIYHEIVEDCATVEDFINRHFGSVVPSEHGVTVTLVDDDTSITAGTPVIEVPVESPVLTPTPTAENAAQDPSTSLF
jgi:hypothetical protein